MIGTTCTAFHLAAPDVEKNLLSCTEVGRKAEGQLIFECLLKSVERENQTNVNVSTVQSKAVQNQEQENITF